MLRKIQSHLLFFFGDTQWRNDIGEFQQHKRHNERKYRCTNQTDHMGYKEIRLAIEQSISLDSLIDRVMRKYARQDHTHHATDTMARKHIQRIVQFGLGSPVYQKPANHCSNGTYDQ